MRVEVETTDYKALRVGDWVVEFTTSYGTKNDRRAAQAKWVITSITSDMVEGHNKAGESKSLFFDQVTHWVVEREAPLATTQPLVQGVASLGKVVEDWPLSCPKCGRAKSAYLGLNTYDCRWGCYARV